jgi:hypothetical protein
MITSLQKHSVPIAKQPSGAKSAARPAAAPAAGKADFQKLFQPAIASATGAGKPSGKVSPTAAATQPIAGTGSAASTPIPIPPITDLRDEGQVEAHMNAWLENVTQQANAQKMQIYQQALSDWQINSQRCQDLGLPAPPQPTAPTLDPVQPMPAGWWFQT